MGTLTPEDARRAFNQRGESQAAWARRHGVSKYLLCEILHGRRKCLRGQSHKIAVMLGLKSGEIFLGKLLSNESENGD
jgi:gp16 family phage-associated protein